MSIKPPNSLSTFTEEAMGGPEEILHESIRSLGKPTVTPTQAKRLDTLGLKFEDLLKLYRESADRETFLTTIEGEDREGTPSLPLEWAVIRSPLNRLSFLLLPSPPSRTEFFPLTRLFFRATTRTKYFTCCFYA